MPMHRMISLRTNRRFASFGRILAPAVLLSIGAGCAQPKKIAAKPDHDLVILLPGVESGNWQLAGVVGGLKEAGVTQEIEIIPWGKWPFGSLDNLTNHSANLERARGIAKRIAAHRESHPHATISLIGYSGGGGIAMMVAEALPPGVLLDRLILVAAAISPDYDTSKALAHIRRDIVNFYSEKDWFILGWGTQTFGTIDRKNTESAGRRGFIDEEGRRRSSPKLTQIGWSGAWVRHGHWGGHIGWLSPWWARDVLAAQLRTD
jgi:pimeloyl-ACP methyl ester carboxylesterase